MAVSIATLLGKPARPRALMNRAPYARKPGLRLGFKKGGCFSVGGMRMGGWGVWVYFVFWQPLGGASTLTQLEALLRKRLENKSFTVEGKRGRGLKGRPERGSKEGSELPGSAQTSPSTEPGENQGPALPIFCCCLESLHLPAPTVLCG